MSARADAVLEPRLFADFAVPGTGAEAGARRPGDDQEDGAGDGAIADRGGGGPTEPDAVRAERAWLAGDAVAAIAAADRALAA
ncbi:hypothetical protein, partial [Pseudonocardia humida]